MEHFGITPCRGLPVTHTLVSRTSQFAICTENTVEDNAGYIHAIPYYANFTDQPWKNLIFGFPCASSANSTLAVMVISSSLPS